MKKLLFFLMLLVGCGSVIECQTRGPTKIDPTLRPYFDSFYAELSGRGLVGRYRIVSMGWVDDIDRNEGDPGEMTAGMCYKLSNPLGQYRHWITINKKTRPEILEATVWHELAHCVLGLDHHPLNGQIMYEIIPEQLTQENKDVLFEDYKKSLKSS